MRRRHLGEVVRIERDSGSGLWTRAHLESELAMVTSRVWLVALAGAEVWGFGGVMITGPEAHTMNVAVAPEVRRVGVGSRLLAALLRSAAARGAQDATLEVRASNAAALGVYRSFGMAPEGVRPRYYSDPIEDALILWVRGIASLEYSERLVSLVGPPEQVHGSG